MTNLHRTSPKPPSAPKSRSRPTPVALTTIIRVRSRAQPCAAANCSLPCRAASGTPTRLASPSAITDFTASCTCPYELGGYCKHVVATLLTVNDDNSPVPIDTKPPVAVLLDGLDAVTLRGLMHRVVEANPLLLDIVDEFCSYKTP